MKKYSNIINEMKNGTCLLIDGATATEMERRGVPQLPRAWNGGGALTHPNVLKDIHKQYIEIGARVIITNTFANCKHTLEDANQVHNFESLNSKAVHLAREACFDLNKQDDVLVAGGISYWSFTGNHPCLKKLKTNIAEQALILENAGADILILEMMVDIDRMLITIEAAKSVTLPVWVGLSCKPNFLGAMCLLNGEPLNEAIKHLKLNDIDLLNIMHTDIADVEACLNIVKEDWVGLTGVYAHSGNMNDSNWTFDEVVSPDFYAKKVSEWMSTGINLVGGCCGITTDHMRYLSKTLF